jgi:hypothetical protein
MSELVFFDIIFKENIFEFGVIIIDKNTLIEIKRYKIVTSINVNKNELIFSDLLNYKIWIGDNEKYFVIIKCLKTLKELEHLNIIDILSLTCITFKIDLKWDLLYKYFDLDKENNEVISNCETNIEIFKRCCMMSVMEKALENKISPKQIDKKLTNKSVDNINLIKIKSVCKIESKQTKFNLSNIKLLKHNKIITPNETCDDLVRTKEHIQINKPISNEVKTIKKNILSSTSNKKCIKFDNIDSDVIKYILEMNKNAVVSRKINYYCVATELNKNNIKPPNNSKLWYKTHIEKICKIFNTETTII